MTAGNGDAPSPRAQEILTKAAKLFYRDGFNAVGMRMIAEAVGVRPASIYHHFVSKEQMLYEIILEVTRNFIDEKLPLLEGSGPRPERLEGLLRAHIVYFWEHRYFMSVGVRELRHLSEEHQAEIRHHRVRYQRAIQHFIADGVADGEFVTDDPSLMGLAVLDLVNGVNGWFSERGRRSLHDVAEFHARLVVRHLLAPPPPTATTSTQRRSRPPTTQPQGAPT